MNDEINSLILKGMPDEDLKKYTQVLAKQLLELFLSKVNEIERQGIQPTSRRIAEKLQDVKIH